MIPQGSIGSSAYQAYAEPCAVDANWIEKLPKVNCFRLHNFVGMSIYVHVEISQNIIIKLEECIFRHCS